MFKKLSLKISYLFAIIITFSISSLAQTPQDLDKILSNPSENSDPKSQDAIKDNSTEDLINKISGGFSALSLTTKAPSLMLDADEHNNVDRAIESLKTNQTYTPDGEDENSQKSNSITKDKEDLDKEEELAKLEEKRAQESEKSYIYLASILYFSPENWAVWVNNQKITPKDNTEDKELYLRSVEQDKVKLFWRLSMSKWKIISGQKSESLAPKVNKDNQVEIEFELRPNQTFILSQNAVIEGRVKIKRKKLSKKNISSE